MSPHHDDFQLHLEYAPPQYESVDPDRQGRWVELRRFGAGAVLATDDHKAIGVHSTDVTLNPDHADFPADMHKILRVLRTAGLTVSAAFDALVKHPEYPVRGREHRGRLAAARYLSDCIAHDPAQMATFTATFHAETEAYSDVMLSSVHGIAALKNGWWKTLDDRELERRYDGFVVLDISAHGVAYIEQLLRARQQPQYEDIERFQGPSDALHPDHVQLVKDAEAKASLRTVLKNREPYWYGTVEATKADERELALADAAKAGEWDTVIKLIKTNLFLTPNRWRPTGRSLYTPLHQAAWHGAPVEVVQRLLRLGAWRTLRTVKGERALDVARKKEHWHLLEILEPKPVHRLTSEDIAKLDQQLANVIEARIRPQIKTKLRHPTTEVLTETRAGTLWYPIPGMYGGFSIRLREKYLYVTSWSRVVGGSGQAHLVTREGSVLVDSGFA